MTERRPLEIICHRLSARRLTAIVLAATVVLSASASVAWNGEVPAWEVDILTFFNDWPDWLEPPMWLLQQAGVLFAPIIVGIVIVAFTRRWQHLVPFVMVVPLKLGIEKGLIKKLVERERPFLSVGPQIEVRGTGFDGFSFPSGHATTAFATAFLVAAFLPRRWRPVPLIWAGIVAVSRMYFGEHNLLDVVAGAAAGTAFAAILWFVFLNRFVHPDCDCPA